MTLSQSQNRIKSLKPSLKRAEVCDKTSSCHPLLVASPEERAGDVLTVLNSPCSFPCGVGGGRQLPPCPTPRPHGTATPSPAARRCPPPRLAGDGGTSMGRGTQQPFPTPGTWGRCIFSKDLLKRIRRTFHLSLATRCPQKLHVAVGSLGQTTRFSGHLAAFLVTSHPALTSVCFVCGMCEVHSPNYNHLTLPDYTFRNCFGLWHFWSGGNMQNSG